MQPTPDLYDNTEGLNDSSGEWTVGTDADGQPVALPIRAQNVRGYVEPPASLRLPESLHNDPEHNRAIRARLAGT